MANASLRLRKLIVTPQGGKPFLLVEVDIQGPEGELSFRLPGAYLATLAQHFTLIQQEHPELCGVLGTVKDRLDWEGEVHPGKEHLN